MKLEKLTISNSDKLSMISNLSTMINAGITITEALDSLIEDAKGNLKKILEVANADIIQGQPLNASLAKFPLVFDKVTVNIIKASEKAGTLDTALKDLKENIKKDIEFTDKVKSAMTYPLVIMVVFVGIIVLMLTFVIPKIAKVFLELKLNLPLPTRILIAVSKFIFTYTIPTIIGLAAMALFFFWLYRTKKRDLLNFLFSLPYVSNLAREIDLTRFSRSMYLLLNSGVAIITALEYAADVVAKKDIINSLIHAREMVASGRRLSEGLRTKKNVFPSIMIKIIEAGEKSGTLERSMLDLSEYFDYQVSNTLRLLMTLLEPLILVAVGVSVGSLMIAIIAPIYGLIGQIGTVK